MAGRDDDFGGIGAPVGAAAPEVTGVGAVAGTGTTVTTGIVAVPEVEMYVVTGPTVRDVGTGT